MAKRIPSSAFTKSLPKVELHAHLTGSISPSCLHQIWKQKTSSTTTSSTTTTLQDPTIALAPPENKTHHDISTFFKIFDTYIYALVNSPETVTWATQSVLKAFETDGVKYLELRTTPRECVETGMTKEKYLEAVLKGIEEFSYSSSSTSTSSSSNSLSTRLILSIDRRNSLEQAMQVIDLAIHYREKGIVGIDLCGNPMVGPVRHLAPAFSRAKAEGFKLTLHFAEVPASSSEEEMRMLLLEWRPERIGHVIYTSPEIEDEIEKLGIGLELCLSCNVLAKMLPGKAGFDAHHFAKWRKKRNPIALSVSSFICVLLQLRSGLLIMNIQTDDVGVFGSPVSNEYLLAAQHFELDGDDLIELSRSAVASIFGGDSEKARLYSLLDLFAKESSLDK